MRSHRIRTGLPGNQGTTMIKPIMRKTLVTFCCFAAGLAWADEDENTESVSQVDLRVSVIENIEVTSDKAPSPDAEKLHPDIEAILEEADELEEEPVQE